MVSLTVLDLRMGNASSWYAPAGLEPLSAELARRTDREGKPTGKAMEEQATSTERRSQAAAGHVVSQRARVRMRATGSRVVHWLPERREMGHPIIRERAGRSWSTGSPE